MSFAPSVPPASSSSGLSPDNRASFRTKTVATRLSVEELTEVEAAAERSGKTLAEWLRELALKSARERPADPLELVLSEVAATRFMLLSLFHASAQAVQQNTALTPETVLQIRESADKRKLGTARKLMEDFLAGGGR